MQQYSRTGTLVVGGLVILLGVLMAINIPGISLILSYWPVLLIVLGLVLVGTSNNLALGLIIAVVGLQVLSLRLDWPADTAGNTFRGVLFILIGILAIVMFSAPKKPHGPSE